MENCIFCKIVSGEISTAKIYEDENFLAFLDIHPQAPDMRRLSLSPTIAGSGTPNIGEYFEVVRKIAKAQQKALIPNGYLKNNRRRSDARAYLGLP